MKYLFISGMGRTGTTLLEKILCNHRQISVVSQPFPKLFVSIKKTFLARIGYPAEHNVLSHFFQEDKYGVDDLGAFLGDYRVTGADLLQVFQDMENYSGQYTRTSHILAHLKEYDKQLFVDVFRDINYLLRHNERASMVGSKETHCEEFFPHFLSHGIKCILILRDPRDVIASFNYGRGAEYGGDYRPTLFYIRNWRKSVAFAIELENDPNFISIKYEDLILNFDQTITAITRFLNVENFKEDRFINGIYDQKGKLWKGNSSFGEKLSISAESIEKFKKLVPEKMVRYIEAACYPEMKFIGYSLYSSASGFMEGFKSFTEPFPIKRKEFVEKYSSAENNYQAEKVRIDLLNQTDVSPEEIKRNFIFNRVFQVLQQIVNETIDI